VPTVPEADERINRRPARREDDSDDRDDREGRRPRRRERVEVPGTLPGGPRAVAAIVFLAFSGLVHLLSVPTDLMTGLTIGELQQFQRQVVPIHRGVPPAREAEVRERLELLEYANAGIGVASLVALVGGAITFAMWMYRAHANLKLLDARGLAYTPGWAAGAFFVPILQLFRPCQIAQEIWRASDPRTADDDDPWRWKHASGSGLIGFWWAFWILGNITGNVSTRAGLFAKEEDLDAQQVAAYSGVVSSALFVVAAALAIAVVRAVQARQQRKFAKLYGDEAGDRAEDDLG
jgi:hypothetical protein